MTIWDLQATIARRLLAWSALSALAGVGLVLVGSPFWQGLGVQALIWGGIDAAIALVGRWLARRRQAAGLVAAELRREEERLRRILVVNAALDVLYVGSGLLLALTMGASEPLWRGHGWGIVIQGAFLFFFDLLHARMAVSG